ncbi:type VII secretion integral membrane protein EccD [Streptomyces sp. NPDC026673]|uniref:type VII secretion integral membrane protein EccD n=1 Tax=Streptomyces sp. NPDC026673 TaxID=3155724 RepID=UPI0033CB9A0D
MTEASVANLCRLTIHVPDRTLDLAVPADVAIADLLPTVLRYAGTELEEQGIDHGGWILQRLGDAPLDGEATLDSLGFKDGEVLHLKPFREAFPPVHIDDLVSGIADVTRDRLHGWKEETSRRLLRGFMITAVLIALGILIWPGGPTEPRTVTAAVAAVLLLAGAATASHAMGDLSTGVVLGFMAMPCLMVTGWLLPEGSLSGPEGYHVLGAKLMAVGSAGSGAALLALTAVGGFSSVFLSSMVVTVSTALMGGLMTLLDVSVDQAAALLAVLVVLLGSFIPGISFSLAGMRMPTLPGNARELQEDIEPHQSQEVSTRTELAAEWMTALYAAVGVIGVGCLLAFARRPNLPEALTCLALTLLLLLHGRGMVNTWQRLALVLPGTLGAALLVIALAAHQPPANRTYIVGALLALVALLVIATWTVPGRRMLPYWGRATELLHSLLAISMLPLALWTLGLLGYLRGMNG